MYCSRRALVVALAAEFTLVWVDVCEVVLDADSAKWADLSTLTTADATSLTSLHNDSATACRAASHVYRTILRPLLAKRDKSLRASLDAGSTRRTLIRVDLHKTGL